jgi:hypothetical protein
MRQFRKVVGLWWAATIHGIVGVWFGSAIACAGVVMALVQHEFSFFAKAQWWVVPVLTILFALILASIYAVIFAPRRVRYMLNPFEIKVVSGVLASEYPSEPFERQRAAISIKNESYTQRSNCELHVQTVSDFDNQHNSFPRFIKEFSVQPGETQQIEFLSWTPRKAPLENDKVMVFCGPVGWGWGGNFVALPCGSYDMEIRIGVPDGDATRIFCRVWIEGDELKAAKTG